MDRDRAGRDARRKPAHMVGINTFFTNKCLIVLQTFFKPYIHSFSNRNRGQWAFLFASFYFWRQPFQKERFKELQTCTMYIKWVLISILYCFIQLTVFVKKRKQLTKDGITKVSLNCIYCMCIRLTCIIEISGFTMHVLLESNEVKEIFTTNINININN